MEILFSDIVNLVQILIWPIFATIFVIIYRASIKKFFKSAGKRMSKVSIANLFAIELQEVSEFKISELKIGQEAIYQTIANREIYSSNLAELRRQFQNPSASDCTIINLDITWFSSRLFLFAFLLKNLRNLRCMVFVQTGGDMKNKYLGNATPEQVQDAIARTFPKYSPALDKALKNKDQPSIYEIHAGGWSLPALNPDSPLTLSVVDFVSEQFVTNITEPNSLDAKNYVKTGRGYENACIIDLRKIREILGKEFNESFVIKRAGMPEEELKEELLRNVLRGSGPFTAELDSNHVFRTLIDRNAVLEEVSKTLGYSK